MTTQAVDTISETGEVAAAAWREQFIGPLEALGFTVRRLKVQRAAHLGATVACSLRAKGERRVIRCEWMVHFSRRSVGDVLRHEVYCQFTASRDERSLLFHENTTFQFGTGSQDMAAGLRMLLEHLANPSPALEVSQLVDRLDHCLSL